MTQLTEKQIKARAYYAANAGKIKKQKREAYEQSVNKKEVSTKIPKNEVVTPAKKLAKSDEPHEVKTQHITLNVRKRIEDLHMQREVEALFDLSI